MDMNNDNWIDELKYKSNVYVGSNKVITNYNTSEFSFVDLEEPESIATKNLIGNLNQDEAINLLCEMFDNSNPNHMNFKLLCESSKNNKAIKEIICSCMQDAYYNPKHNENYAIDYVYLRVTQTLLTIPDFKIVTSDNKKIKCFKLLLMSIPYFKMVFEDFNIKNKIKVDVNMKLMLLIIKSIYNYKISYDKIDPHTYIELLILMDKYLMDTQLLLFLILMGCNISEYVIKLVNDGAIEKVKVLYDLLKRIINRTGNDFTFSFAFNVFTHNDLIKQAQFLLQEISNINIGDKITLFDDWINMFSDSVKLKYVYSTKKYELLNIIKVNPVLILAFMARIDFSNDIYHDILRLDHCIISDDMKTNYKRVDINRVHLENNIFISSYYPVFKYIKFFHVDKHYIKKIIGCSVKVSITYPENYKIKIGDTIVCSNKDENIKYTINSITKHSDNMTINVNTAHYINQDLFDDVYFKLQLDKNIDTNCDDIYLCQEFSHDISQTI